ncbi:MAG: hypothetical protein JWL82_470 [Parcubacteria group bacterium]|nr:hypothetical protein [Parcubacteria group bacterium]
MRLLVATPLYPPDSGGPATYAKALVEGLPGMGIEVVLVSFSDVRHLPKLIRHLAYFWNVLLASRGTDLILALDPVSVGLPTSIAAFFARKTFVVKVVGDYAWEQGRERFGLWLPLDEFVRTSHIPFPVYLFRVVQTFVAGRAHTIIVPSNYLKRIVTVWGIQPDHIVVIVNAEPSEAPGVVPVSVASALTPRIVTSGRLVPWKGMQGVIAAMITVRESIPNAELIIIGDGPDRDTLERYAQVRIGSGYVFTGSIPHAEALAVMQTADVFVLNSTYEGLSHILLEALSLGKAIVATNAGGNPEVIQHEENGLLISVGDPEQLSASILSILKNTSLRSRLEISARESSKCYSVQNMLTATSELLASLT